MAMSDEYKVLHEYIALRENHRHQLLTLAVLSTGAIIGVALKEGNCWIYLLPILIILPLMWRTRRILSSTYFIQAYISSAIESFNPNEFTWYSSFRQYPHTKLFHPNSGRFSRALYIIDWLPGTSTAIYISLLIICMSLANVMWREPGYAIWLANILVALIIVIHCYFSSPSYKRRIIASYLVLQRWFDENSGLGVPSRGKYFFYESALLAILWFQLRREDPNHRCSTRILAKIHEY